MALLETSNLSIIYNTLISCEKFQYLDGVKELKNDAPLENKSKSILNILSKFDESQSKEFFEEFLNYKKTLNEEINKNFNIENDNFNTKEENSEDNKKHKTNVISIIINFFKDLLATLSNFFKNLFKSPSNDINLNETNTMSNNKSI